MSRIKLLFAVGLALAIIPEIQTVRQHGVASFLCRVTGAGKDRDLAWFKNDRRVTERSLNTMLVNSSTDGLVMRIFPVARRDKGEFKCKVVDRGQTLFASAQLIMLEEGRGMWYAFGLIASGVL